MTTALWDREIFVEKLRAIGVRGYHDKHPFHVAMNEGRLSPEALRGWVANRFYYQKNIPIKDAAILANCPVREVRRAWIHRIFDHDGVSSGVVASAVLSGESGVPHALGTAHATGNEGGIEAWLRFDPCGLDYFRGRVTQARHDSDEALAITLEYCNAPVLQREAVRALEFKCDVLWSMLDAIHHGYGGLEIATPA